MESKLRRSINPKTEVYVYLIGVKQHKEDHDALAGRVFQILGVAESRFQFGDSDRDIMNLIRDGTKYAFPERPEVNYVITEAQKLTVYLDFTKNCGSIYFHTSTH